MNITDIPGKLRRISKMSQVAGVAQSLVDLADAIESGTGKERWAHVDLFAAFLGRDSIRPVKPPAGRIRTALEYAPSILVFVPLLATWAGLAIATWRYRATLDDPKLSGQPFLQRWENGFDGHLWRFLTFDWFALATVTAILLLLAASVAQAVVARTAEKQQLEEERRVRHELTSAIIAADLELAPGRRVVSGDVGAEMGRLAKEIDRATAALGDTATKIEEAGITAGRSQRDAIAALKQVRAVTTRLEQSAVKVEDASGAAGQAATVVGGELQKVSAACDALAVATAAAGAQLGTAGNQMGGRFEAIATRFEDRLRQATEENQRAFSDSIGSSAKLIATALSDGTGQVRDALADIRTTGAAYTHRAEEAADQLGLASESLKQLSETVGRLESRLAAVHRSEDKIAKVLADLKGSLDAADRTVNKAGQNELRDVLTRLAESVRELEPKAVPQVRSTATRGGILAMLRGR